MGSKNFSHPLQDRGPMDQSVNVLKLRTSVSGGASTTTSGEALNTPPAATTRSDTMTGTPGSVGERKTSIRFTKRAVASHDPHKSPRAEGRYRAFVLRKGPYLYDKMRKRGLKFRPHFNIRAGITRSSVEKRPARVAKMQPGQSGSPRKIALKKAVCRLGYYGGSPSVTLIEQSLEKYNSCFWKNVKFFGILSKTEPYWFILIRLITVCGITTHGLKNMQRIYLLYVMRRYEAFYSAVTGMINSFPKDARKFAFTLSRTRYKEKVRLARAALAAARPKRRIVRRRR